MLSLSPSLSLARRVLVAIKQKRQNYGVNEFVLRAFDYDGNVIGRFDDQQAGSLTLKHHTCPNGATVRSAFHLGIVLHGCRSHCLGDIR